MATGVQLTAGLPPGVGLGQITLDQGSCSGPIRCCARLTGHVTYLGNRIL